MLIVRESKKAPNLSSSECVVFLFFAGVDLWHGLIDVSFWFPSFSEH